MKNYKIDLANAIIGQTIDAEDLALVLEYTPKAVAGKLVNVALLNQLDELENDIKTTMKICRSEEGVMSYQIVLEKIKLKRTQLTQYYNHE